jgi:hypothetical protein
MPRNKGQLNIDDLVAEARARTGLEDLGPDTWQEGLEVLVRSLNEEAAPIPRGEGVTAEELRRRFAFYHERFPALTGGRRARTARGAVLLNWRPTTIMVKTKTATPWR